MHFHKSDGWYAGIAAAQWLALRLQTIAAFVISLVALLAVLGHEALLPFAVSDGKFAASKPSLLIICCVLLLQVKVLSAACFYDKLAASKALSPECILCRSCAVVCTCS